MTQFEEYAEKGLELKALREEWDNLEQALLENATPGMKQKVELIHLLIVGNDKQRGTAMLSIAAQGSR